MSHLKLQLLGHRLMTAEILYRMPDHPSILQSFVWQEYDMAPHFPVLKRFLRFWESNLDGALHRVRIASAALVRPAEFRYVRGELLLH